MKTYLILLAILPFVFSCKTKNTVVDAKENSERTETYEIVNKHSGETTTLVSVKKENPSGNWRLQSIGESRDEEVSRITLTIDNKKMQANGNDACNNFSGEIETIDQRNIKFLPMASTKRACIVPATYAEEFYQTLEHQVRTFKATEDFLIFMNEDGEEVMQFIKKED